MESMTRQYSTVASQASDATEKAADFWTQGVGKLAGRLPALLPQVDLVPAVERYFDFVQRAVTMNRSIAVEWAQAVSALSGAARERAASASEVVREGLRLVEEREARLLALRATLDASIAQGGEVTDEELDDALAARSIELRSKGFGA